MRLNGLIAAPFTPFQLDGAIRASLVKPYAEHLAADERVRLAEAWKAGLRIVGIDCGDVRKPLRSLDEDQQAELKAELARGGFLQFLTKSESANA